MCECPGPVRSRPFRKDTTSPLASIKQVETQGGGGVGWGGVPPVHTGGLVFPVIAIVVN